MPLVEHHAVVPADGGASLLVVDGRLPCVSGEGWRQPEVLERLAPLVGRPAYLRLAAQVELSDERVLRLHVFDATSHHGARVALDDADPAALAPPELRPALERWLAEKRGAPVPPQRPPWARPDWHAEAEAWAGTELRVLRLWPLSAVLHGELNGTPVYFKAVFPLFHHEPAVTEVLAREHPGAVPDVLAVEHERGWMLMGELPGRPEWQVPDLRWAGAIRSVGAIQRAWVGRSGELLALGAQDRGLATLRAEVAGRPELERCLEQLEALGLPETLGHGDLHAGNFALGDQGAAVVFDWSDAFVGHPLFDLAHFLHHVEDERTRGALADAWADGWGEPLPPGALELAAPLSCVHQAVSYRAIAASCEPGDRALFDAEPPNWLDEAYRLARGNALQPG